MAHYCFSGEPNQTYWHMELTVLTLSCFLFYLTSKYFPLEAHAQRNIAKWKPSIMIFSTMLLLLSMWLFTFNYNLITAIIIWFIALMAILSILIISIKSNLQWTYVWGLISIIVILINL